MDDTTTSFRDLLSDPGVWSTWAPRPELEPRFEVDGEGGPGGRPALAISGGGNPVACGGWQLRSGHQAPCAPAEADLRQLSCTVIAPGLERESFPPAQPASAGFGLTRKMGQARPAAPS